MKIKMRHDNFRYPVILCSWFNPLLDFRSDTTSLSMIDRICASIKLVFDFFRSCIDVDDDNVIAG